MIVSQLELGLPVVKPDWLKVLADYLCVWSIGLNVLIGFQKAYINVWITSWKFTVNIAKYKLMFVCLNKTLAVLERHSFMVSLKVAHVGRFVRKAPYFVDSNLKIKDMIQQYMRTWLQLKWRVAAHT